MVEFEDFEIFYMGTNIIRRICGTNAKEIAILVENELKRLESLMSFYINSSDVGRLNLEAGQAQVPLSKETFEVTRKSPSGDCEFYLFRTEMVHLHQSNMNLLLFSFLLNNKNPHYNHGTPSLAFPFFCNFSIFNAYIVSRWT